MTARIRFSLAIALLLGIGAFIVLIVHDPGANASSAIDGASANPTNTTPPPRFTTSKQCAECHREVYDEWMGSHHQIAYENPEVRKLSDDFRNKECQACHLPRPIVETGLLERTLPRITRPDEGVDCLTCHLGPGGRIVGKIASDRGCMPIADERHMGVELCQTCHNQHQTTDQWRASAWPAKGYDCNACHMPETLRADGKKGRGHVYPGAHDLEMLRKAGDFRMNVADGKVVLELENVFAGHNFPTEERHRAVDIVVRFTTQEGVGDWTRVHRFRQPYRDEPGENTQLPAGATHRAEVELPEGASRVEARLWYRLNPFALDDDPASTLLFELAKDLQ